MSFRHCASIVLWAAFPLSLALGAATIDVPFDVSFASLAPGDALRFEIPSWNYGFNALRYGLPVYPTSVGFVFVSAATDAPARFDVSLQSGDGSISQTFGAPLTFDGGAFSSSGYSGPVATVTASWQLSHGLSPTLF